MNQTFFQPGLADVCSSEEYISFISSVHRGHCNDSDPCKTMIFHNSLKTFFEDSNNTWEEKKQYFAGLSEKNKNIILNIYHLKKFCFYCLLDFLKNNGKNRPMPSLDG